MLLCRTAAGASAYLFRVEFFKVGKIAQLNTVSHGQCMSTLPINLSNHAVTVDGASRLELVCDCCLTELALVVSRTKAAVTNKVEGASPLACP